MIPGIQEQPGALSGQQQQQSFNFSSSIIPIKKRRFPIIQPAFPPEEEIPCESEENKRGLNIPDEKLSVNSDVSKTCASVVEKEEVTPRNIKLVQANVEPFASKPREAKPCISLGPKDDLMNTLDIALNEKLPESEVKGNSMASCIMNVKQEISSGKTELPMNVELPIGPKEPLIPAFEQQNSECIGDKSDKSDHSLLSLSLSKEKPVLHDNVLSNISSGACSDRSNWDLNTTMDAWESSIDSDAFAHRFVDISGFSKTDNIDSVKSSLTTTGTIDLCLNKGKSILDERRTNSNTPVKQFEQGKIDDSVGLRLGMPYSELDFSRASYDLSNKLTSAGPNINLQQAQLSAMNLSIASGRIVKSEPVDENLKRDSSIGSRSSHNMGLSKSSSVKRELVANHSSETMSPSSVGPDKLLDRRSIKSELVLPQAVGSVVHHEESCASSSSSLSVPSMPQNSCRSKLSTCSESSITGDLSSQSQHSFHSKEVHDDNDIPHGLTAMVSKPVSQDDKPLQCTVGNLNVEDTEKCQIGNLNVEDTEKCQIGQTAEHTLGLCAQREISGNDEERISKSAEIVESHENCAVDTSMNVRAKISHKEDEYEDGEIRESLQPSSGENPFDKEKKIQNVERECDSKNMQPCVNLGYQDTHASELDGQVLVSGNHNETQSDGVEESVMIGYEPRSEDNNPLQDLPDEVLEVGVDEKRCISVVTPEKQLDLSGIEDVEEGPGDEVSSEKPTNGNDEATDKVVKEICSENHELTSNNVEASVNGGNDAAKDSNHVGNKNRIINLSCATVVTSPCKTKPVPNKLLTSGSGKERCPGPDGEIQPRGYRDEVHAGGLNKYANDRDCDHSFRNSRQSFTRGSGRGRGSGRFGSSRSEWNSNHDFASENYNGPSDYRPIRRKHASSISDVDREFNGYDDTSFGSNRRKTIKNDEFSLSRRSSFRRLSPGERDGPVNNNRGNQMLRRVPRNISPSRCDIEDNSNLVGFRHGDKFMRHLSDDMIDPVYARPQAMYDEVDDGQPVRGNMNFSTMQRKGYPRIRSKSPNGLSELNQNNRSPAMYRTARMRSPDRACFRDEMTRRRGGSPSFVTRHPNDSRDVESHHRSSDSNRRSFSSPTRVFQRTSRRGDALDSREIRDGDEYIDNGPPLTNKFRGDGRRKYIERQRPVRSFRPSYDGDGDNFHFHSDDGGPRPYRFCPDVDTEFSERSSMREREFEGREREFEGRIKHQPLVVSRQSRDIDEQQDGNGNYRPGGRVWHDDGFSDVSRGKRRRF